VIANQLNSVAGSVLGVGVDLVEIARIAQTLDRTGEAFVNRVLTPNERQQAAQKTGASLANFVAKRWAAKEAVAKALGTGIRGDVSFQSIEVGYTDLGQPTISVNDEIIKRFAKSDELSCRAGLRFHLSFTDSDTLVIAFVVIENLNKKF
jgi:holo-[acyl-carrier protein] synthase